MEIRKIFVVGSGLMGSGIAQTALQYGYEVILNDQSDRFPPKPVAWRKLQGVQFHSKRRRSKWKSVKSLLSVPV